MDRIQIISNHFATSIETKAQTANTLTAVIAEAGNYLIDALLANKKILICGNGGSAADSQHFAAELVNRYHSERPSLPAIALTNDSVTITAIANDYEYSAIFAKQIAALGQKDDVLIVISTSGNSPNILQAITTAQKQRLKIIALTGRDGGKIAKLLQASDLELRVPSQITAHIQETHIAILHILCELIDHCLFTG